MLALVMQCLSEAIYRCDAVAGISFTSVMAEKGIKVVLSICALLGDTDQLFSCLRHNVILQELMRLPCICLEVGAS